MAINYTQRNTEMLLVVFAFTTELSYVKQKKVTFTSGPLEASADHLRATNPLLKKFFF